MARNLHSRTLMTTEIRLRMHPALYAKIRRFSVAEDTTISGQIRDLLTDAVVRKDDRSGQVRGPGRGRSA